jgi:hypothetical protein
MRAEAYHDLVRSLTWGQTATITLIGTAVFLFADGPFWDHLWDLKRVDRAIWLSYAIVPLLVALVLVRSGRFAWSALAFGTIETTAYKFGATFVIAHAAWSFVDPAPRIQRIHRNPIAAKRAPLVPSTIDPEQTGEIRGRAPAGSLVYVASGLDHLVFAPDDRPLILQHDGHGLAPRFSAVQVGQPIDVVSHDERIHTMRATDSRHMFRKNLALPPSTTRSTLPFDRALGRLNLDCTVHRGEEDPAELVVLAHPFFARADESGTFSLRGVPAGHLVITALSSVPASVEVDLAPGGALDLAL